MKRALIEHGHRSKEYIRVRGPDRQRADEHPFHGAHSSRAVRTACARMVEEVAATSARS